MAGLYPFGMKHFFSLMRGWLVALFVLLGLAGPAARAQAPAWQTAVAAQNTNSGVITGYSYVYGMAADATDNVYITGEYQGSVAFGSTTLTTTSFGFDVFVAKWSNSSQRFVWAMSMGGTDTDNSGGIAVSGNNVYVTGSFVGATASFGPLTLTNSSSSFDGFVAKLTDAGTSASFTWVRQLGGTGSDLSYGIAARGTSVYAVGFYGSAVASFGTIALANSSSAVDGFVTKLTDTGTSATFTWAQSIGGASDEQVRKVAVSGNEVVVAGIFSSSALRVGTIALPLASAGSYDVFVAKFIDAGASPGLAWAQKAGGSALESVTGVAIAGSSVYITGAFTGPAATFGTTTLVARPPSGSSYFDGYVAKLIDTGTTTDFAWAQAIGGPGADSATGLAVQGTSLFVAGYSASQAVSIGNTPLFNSGNTHNLFIAKLTDAANTGSLAWVRTAHGPNAGNITSLALQGSTVVVAGSATPLFSFGGITITGSNNSGAAFLASLTDPTLTATTAAKGALSFSLAPNPARATTTVQLPAGLGASTAALTLRDALGRTLRTSTVALPAAGLRHALDLRGLAPGVYAVQVRAGSTSGTQRLVVE